MIHILSQLFLLLPGIIIEFYIMQKIGFLKSVENEDKLSNDKISK